MQPYRTKVERFGGAWVVYVFRCGVWQRMRDFYSTRQKARDGRFYWANF